MGENNQSINQEFISLAQASGLVSCSRDYLSRLVREHKILSIQKDRQWYLDKNSLLNFFENKAIEESVKKRILSQSRKNDLDAVSQYRSRVAGVAIGKYDVLNKSLLLTVLIIFGGLASGLFLNFAAVNFSHVPAVNMAQAVSAVFSEEKNSFDLGKKEIFNDHVVTEFDESIPMRDGVVIFPAVPASPSSADLFSDEVSVVFTSTTTGFVRSEQSDLELPFVRVPQNNYHDQ